MPGGSVGRDQLAMAAKVRRHWFNPCRLGSRGHLGANFSLLLYTDLIKKRKPSRYFTDEGELIRDYIYIYIYTAFRNGWCVISFYKLPTYSTHQPEVLGLRGVL